ncbi:type I DNA topoisomerase [Pseudonocardia sp. KRD-184]|uniref:DNA topoisomerase 1 n=1 Tax=Pseudonocardia oceani TaxID=2792013 RepID=A0ABS6U9C6_9PSEU|nr:type I DNA topoisomerase [Pseudonocardia oceani]MBW0091633.1 type I DNA topoisomerase [Pseudonocardia oceani]MBW0097675.1 type I DNA topoisomerase [Pseudonocardia oceani]MBW0108562.1 type I DNA topoisomerase [Pseudonocardia oceani]MBW0122334.1 type I DNA topoisomerase [Pseudonocardia oceani]MBW0128578.1 type I DNA topoisomerase [Pseudonocardia oceani]
MIVESGTKAAKIQKFLGKDYVVEASVGHIRDLPRGAADVPAKHKGEAWARLGVDVDNSFAPLYIITPEKRSKVAELREALKSVDELLLATDPDREGEAIAWHLLDTLKPKVPVRRMVFHEISEPAIRAAVENLRDLDQDMVDAQETRRILDRLYGYEVSPVLWKKVMPKLSAGRVQSVATRIVVARERERMAFVSASYWDIAALMDAGAEATPRQFGSRLVAIDGARVATGRDFGPDGRLKSDATALDEAGARRLAEALEGRDLTVESVESKPYTRKPYPPFMTSTLQQEAGRKLRFSADRTMRSAQRLYENGYITYLRTDSTTLSASAIDAARSQARELYGDAYVPDQPRQYTRKVKNAQEAHEAIRPAGDVFRTPGEIAREVDGDDFRLYELIWQRTVASQMADARGTTVSVRIAGTAATGEAVTFATSGRTITFPGFLRAYVETVDDQAGGEADDAESRLPELTKGQSLTAASLTAEGHSTNPPSRFTEPSLIKQLEDLGIGRPSTYASIIKTIQDRGYVWKKGQALVPSWIAFAVVGLLEHHFGRLVDYDFTAAMEDELDAIAAGTQGRTSWLSGFYFGAEQGSEGSVARAGGLKKLVGVNLEEIDAREINSVPVFDDVVVRVGRYGPYLERVRDGESQRANLPEDLPPDELTPEVAEQLFSVPQEGRSLGVDPISGHEIVAKEGRYGPYVTEVLPEPEAPPVVEGAKPKKAPAKPKPRTGSLFKGMSTETITLEDALRLLSLPRLVGTDPESGEEITAQNGRYGPYLKKGTDSRSLTDEEQLFTVTLEEAVEIYKQPKQRGRRTAAATPPLRELGVDANSKKPMVIKDGRFGPYVTDGETNASLRKGDSVEQITDERASELLAERRAKAPAPKKAPAARKPAARKPAAKKPAAKRAPAAKKAPVEK